VERPLKINLVEGSRELSYKELEALPPLVSYSDLIIPIQHEYFVSQILTSAENEGLRLKDAIYSVSHSNARFFGVMEFTSKVFRDDSFGWILAASNANDGTDGISMYGGIRIYDKNTLAFHEELSVIKRHSENAIINLPETVAGAVRKLHEHWNINQERADTYCQLSLTIERAHHIICEAITKEIIAGREINSLLTSYHKQRGEGAGMWTLFKSCVEILNKLKAPPLIQRTIELHHLIDQYARFTKRPSPYIQTRFA
jgi:hypothetical protein